MTVQNGLPNERQLVRNYWGTEAVAGTKVPPTFRMYGDLRLNKARPLADRAEFAGTWFGDYTPVFGPVTVDGTYAQPLTYEDLAILPRYLVKGGVAGASDGNATPGYGYAYRPSAATNDLDTASVEYGHPGMPWEATLVHFREATISADVDDAEAAWKWSGQVLARSKDLKASTTGTATGGTTTTIVQTGAGWTVNAFAGAWVKLTGGTAANLGQVREVLSNTADTLTLGGALPAAVASGDAFEVSGAFTAGVPDRTREVIDAPGTRLYLHAAGTAMGAAGDLVTGRFISFSVTIQINSYLKRMMEDVATLSTRMGRGMVRAAGQVRLEFDSRREYDKWMAKAVERIRIEQTGSVINASPETRKTARIDLFDARYESLSEDDRENNLTATLGFRGFVDATEAVPFEIYAKNRLATLP